MSVLTTSDAKARLSKGCMSNIKLHQVVSKPANPQPLGCGSGAALDKVQKHRPLDADEERLLKEKGLIEGRKPNFYIAQPIAEKMGQKASYSKNRAFDKQYYLDLVCKAAGEHGSLSRKDIDELLWNKLPDWMDDKQRKIKVGNLLSELRRKGRIANRGSDTQPSWALVKVADA